MTIKYLYTGIFFLFIFLSGFWLSRTGKPYSTLIFTIHKLIGLGIGVFLIRFVVQTHKTNPLVSVQIAAIIVTALLFIAAVAAGGALSAMVTPPAILTLIHKIAPYMIVLSTATTLVLLLLKME